MSNIESLLVKYSTSVAANFSIYTAFFGLIELFTKYILTFLSTVGLYLFGGLDVALQAFLLAMVLDYITGLMKGYKSKKLNSKTGLKGIFKKLGLLCLVALAVAIDKVAGNSGLIRTVVIYYLFANEGLSIVENLGEMNVIVPKVIKEKLEQLKEKE